MCNNGIPPILLLTAVVAMSSSAIVNFGAKSKESAVDFGGKLDPPLMADEALHMIVSRSRMRG